MKQHGLWECDEGDQGCVEAAFDACWAKICTCNSGDEDCAGLYDCLADCEEYTCVTACYYTATDEANSTWDTFIDCLELAGYFDCPDEDETCFDVAWASCDAAFQVCVGCTPDCADKNCGDDGCGGSCGECEEGIPCQDGECLHAYWTDSTTGLSWQNPPSTGKDWWPAASYCENLELDGYADWHLPTINELRSLIRGCPETVSGGGCGVTDSCTSLSCFGDGAECYYVCPSDGGPANGCYWPAEMQGPCTWYWSSSVASEGDFDPKWYVAFSSGSVGNGNGWGGHVRCVR